MNTLYDSLEQDDDVLDAVEENLITVNLPNRPPVSLAGHYHDGAEARFDVSRHGIYPGM